MTKHDLKLQEKYFVDVASGRKPFEIRKNDRDYKVGDILILREWVIEGHFNTGRKLTAEITYITDYEQKDGYVVLGIKLLPIDSMYA